MKHKIYKRYKTKKRGGQHYWVGQKTYGSKFMSKRELNKLILRREKEGIIVLPTYEAFIFHDPETRERKVIFEAKKKNYGSTLGRLAEHERGEFGFKGTVPSQEEMNRLSKIIRSGKKKGFDSKEISKRFIAHGEGERVRQPTPEEEDFMTADFEFETGRDFKRLQKKTLPSKETEFVKTIVVDKDTNFGIPHYNISAFTNRGREAGEAMLKPLRDEKNLKEELKRRGFKKVDEHSAFGTKLEKWEMEKGES